MRRFGTVATLLEMIPFVGIFFAFTNTGKNYYPGYSLTKSTESNSLSSRSGLVGGRYRSQEYWDDKDDCAGFAGRGSIS